MRERGVLEKEGGREEEGENGVCEREESMSVGESVRERGESEGGL